MQTKTDQMEFSSNIFVPLQEKKIIHRIILFLKFVLFTSLPIHSYLFACFFSTIAICPKDIPWRTHLVGSALVEEWKFWYIFNFIYFSHKFCWWPAWWFTRRFSTVISIAVFPLAVFHSSPHFPWDTIKILRGQ